MSDPTAPVVLIFGAYGGIGSALTRRLSGRANLTIAGRDPARLAELASEVGAKAITTDAADFQAVEDTVKGVVAEYGRIDAVVNAVGSVMLKPAHLTRENDYADTIRTNLTTAFAVVRAATAAMSRGDGGSILLFSTAAAQMGLPNHEAIAAAKGGVDALVRSAAATYGKAGIRINAIAPGLVDTPMTARITGNERALESSKAMHALGRIGTADEVAAAAAWLLGSDASWITGQTLGVDGGLGSIRSA